jgi:hypothetical protein
MQHRGRGCHIQDSAFREEAMLGFFGRDCQLTGTTLRELPFGCDTQTQVLIRPYDFDRGLVVYPGIMCIPPKNHDFCLAHIYRQAIVLTEILERVNRCLEAFWCSGEQL